MSRLMDIARSFQFDPSTSAAVPSADGTGCDKSDKRVADPYQDLARIVLAKVTDQPIGMVSWLRQNHPALYDELIVGIPDEIHRLWDGRAPVDEFQHILDLWLEAHRTGCEVYRRGQE